MITEHPTVFELLRALEERPALRPLVRRVLAHLARVEPRCEPARKALEEADRRSEEISTRDYTAAFAAAAARTESAARRLEEEVEDARRDLDHLLAAGVGERRDRYDRSRTRYRGAAFAESLLAETRTAATRSARESLELAAIARDVCHRLNEQHYGSGLRRALVLRAEALLANALRASGELPAADRHWELIAARRAAEPVADPGVEADLASLEASLRFDQRRLDEAGELAAEAVRRYREAGDRVGEGRALIQLGNANLRSARLDEAVDSFRRAASRFDPEVEVRDHLHAVNNLALALCSAGDFAAAGDLVAANRHLFARDMDAWSRPRLAGLEGQIAHGLGDDEAAERHLRAALNAYLGEANGFNAAHAALDLARLFMEQGRTVEVKRFAFATHRAFAERQVHPGAAESMRLFAQAAAAEKVTLGLLDRLRARIEAARRPAPAAG